MKIAIISASVRTERNSHRVALYFQNYIKENNIGEATLLDLNEYQFPIFEERLKYMGNPSEKVLHFTEQIKQADGIIIVTPEYNGGYPASLKNVIDLLYAEWKRKPIVISTVSDGVFGGSQVITSLVFSLWKIGAWVVPAMFPVPSISKTFEENGIPTDKEGTDKRAKRFIEELIWCVNANQKMNNRT